MGYGLKGAGSILQVSEVTLLEKNKNLGFRPGLTQSGLYSQEAGKFK